MKLKNILFISLFSLLLFPSFSSASVWGSYFTEYLPWELFYTYSNVSSRSIPTYIDDSLNIHSTVNDSDYWIIWISDSYPEYFSELFWSKDNPWFFNVLYFNTINWRAYSALSNWFFICNYSLGSPDMVSVDRCSMSNSLSSSDFVSIANSSSLSRFIYRSSFYQYYWWPRLCFVFSSDESLAYCVAIPSTPYYQSSSFSSVDLVVQSVSNASSFVDSVNMDYVWNSPVKIKSSSSVYNLWMCPTILEIIRSYSLTENVCYSWFPLSSQFWDSSTFVAWQWLTVFDVYNLYSWWMSLQGWYDTYYEYYKNINSNVSIFSWNSKSLLWIFFARQTFWNWKGSYEILNYCNLIFSDLDYNATTCVASTGSIQLPDVHFSREDTINWIIWYRDTVLSSSWDSFSWDIFDAYEYSFNFWKSFTVVDWLPWILPWYVVVGFFAILLLYLVRR